MRFSAYALPVFALALSIPLASAFADGYLKSDTFLRTSWYHAPRPSTAAHKSLPFGTVLDLKNPKNGRHARVVIRDRGPFIKGRSLDVSKHTAEELGMVKEGVAILIAKEVRLEKMMR